MQTDDQQKKPIGQLFGTINYTSQKDIDMFIEKMTAEQSFYILNLALKYSHAQGIFSLEESEIISKSLRLFSTTPENNG